MPPVTGTDLFVGREREMAQLTAAFEGALVGRGGLVMLAGEPGIGKTRLTEELTEVARDRGAVVTSGVCYEGGSAPPYWPWTQAIRSLLTEPSEATLNALNPRAAVIAEIVPEIREMMPDLQPTPELDPPQARFRFFDAVTSFFDGVASSQPLVVVLDDLHWADRSTLDLLEFVAREVATKPMLIIGGYRDMELSRRHPLSESLATLARVRGFQRIPLRGLEGDEVSRLVKAVGDITLPPELIEEIYVRTEGNPFFVGEVTRDLAREAAEHGGDFDAVKFRIPEGVREAVGIRLNRLSEQCNQVLRTAAVIGREFDFTLLAAVSGELSEDELLDAVHEALVAATIREFPGPGERYEFAHALIQQTLAEELSVSLRTRMHARVVDAMEALFKDHIESHSSDLAYHCAQAGTGVPVEKTVKYAYLAGTNSMARYAYEEASRQFRNGLEASTEGDREARRGDLYLGLARSLNPQGDSPAVIVNLTKAFDAYQLEGNTAGAINAASVGLFRGPGVAPEQVELCRRGLALATPGSPDAAKIMNEYGTALGVGASEFEQGQRMLSDALVIAREQEDKHLEAHILFNSAFVHTAAREFRQSIEKSLEVLSIPELNFPVVEANAHRIAAIGFVAIGETSEARHYASETLRLAKDPDVYLDLATVVDYHMNCVLALNEGRWDDAIEYNRMDSRLLEAAQEFRADQVIEYWTGDPAAALDSLVEHIPARRDLGVTGSFMLAGVITVVSEIGRRLDDQTAISFASQVTREEKRDGYRLTMADDLLNLSNAIIAVAQNDVNSATQHYAELKSQRGTLNCFLVAICPDRLLAMLAMTTGEVDTAHRHFDEAITLLKSAGYWPELGWTSLDYAEALFATGDAEAARKCTALISRGLEIARSSGMRPLEDRLIVLQQRIDTKTSSTVAYPDGLTSREVEVLRLLAAGRTNQQIAGDLVIAPSTAAKHVANIFGKTGSANRAEAGAYAHEHSLTAAQQGAD